MSQKLRWGILGTGNIAHQFARGLTALPDAELVAVGSRAEQTAQKFAEEFEASRYYASYDELAHDPEVDAIYVSTPHSYHKDNTLLCLKAGKAVLCEKPFAINAREAREMIEVARSEQRFLMEALWTRFLPLLVKTRELLADGAIGEPRILTADFGFRTSVNPQGRLFDLKLGGGALLDVGIYPLSLASMVFGRPEQIATEAQLGETGVDEQNATVLRYPGGQLALLSSAIRVTTPHEALIAGTEGSIKLEAPWWKGTRLTLSRSGKDPENIELPMTGNGYNYEAAEVAHCLRAGKLESDVMPLDETLALMETMDQLRAKWGLKYPME